MCDDSAALQNTAQLCWPFFAGFFLAATLGGVWNAEKLAGQEQTEKPIDKIVSPMWWKGVAEATVSARCNAEPLQLHKPRMQDGSHRLSPLQSDRPSPQRRPASKFPPVSSGPGFTHKSSVGASSAPVLFRKSSPQPASSCPEASRPRGSPASRNSRKDPDRASGTTTPDVCARASNGMESRPAGLHLQRARGQRARQDANRPEKRAGPGEPHSSLFDASLLRRQPERRYTWYSWESDESDADDLDDHFIISTQRATGQTIGNFQCFLEQESKRWAPHAVCARRQMSEKLRSLY